MDAGALDAIRVLATGADRAAPPLGRDTEELPVEAGFAAEDIAASQVRADAEGAHR